MTTTNPMDDVEASSSKTLRFFDPFETPYGAFSNYAPYDVVWEDVYYPDVQHAFYDQLLRGYSPRTILADIRDPYSLHAHYQFLSRAFFLEQSMTAVLQAYEALFQEKPIQLLRRHSTWNPYLSFVSETDPIFGIHPKTRQGWNVIGIAIQRLYYGTEFPASIDLGIKIYQTYRATEQLLIRLTQHGNNLGEYMDCTPEEILQQMGLDTTIDEFDESQHQLIQRTVDQFFHQTLPHFSYVRAELIYPKSLTSMILRREAPFLSFYIQDCIDFELLRDSCCLALKDHVSFSKASYAVGGMEDFVRTKIDQLSPQERIEKRTRVRELYSSHRFPLRRRTVERIQQLDGQRKDRSWVQTCTSYTPIHPVVAHTIDEPLINELEISPSFVHVDGFSLDGFRFFTVYHAIWYQLFRPLCLSPLKAYQLLLHPFAQELAKETIIREHFRPCVSFVFYEQYDRLYVEYSIRQLHRLLASKWKRHPYLQYLLFQSTTEGYDTFLCTDPFDPITGYDASLQTTHGVVMNQTGTFLGELRTKYQIQFQQEYQFYQSLVSDEQPMTDYLHAWIRGRVMELQHTLFWYQRLFYHTVPLQKDHIYQFFKIFYKPWYILYKYYSDEKPRKEGADANTYLISLFGCAGIVLSDDTATLLYLFLYRMLFGVLASGKADRKTLLHTSCHVTTTMEEKKIMTEIVQRLKRFDRKTLSAYAHCVLASSPVTKDDEGLLEFPSTTVILFPDSSSQPYYLFMDPTQSGSVFHVLEQYPKISPLMMGDILFVVRYVQRRLSFERYQFLFDTSLR